MRLLRGLTGHLLSCGCLVGLYETYDGQVVASIDAPGPSCDDPAHRPHANVPVDAPHADDTATAGSLD